MKLVILRPSDGAKQSANIAREMGFDPIIASASDICALPWTPPPADDFDGIMITSANALRINADTIKQYRHLPMFAVGKATAKIAQDMGFNMAAIGQGGAKALWPHITQHGAKNILRLVGRDYVEIADTDVKITTLITYQADALPIADALKTLIKNKAAPHIFAFHSARAVQIFDDYIERLASQGIAFEKSAHYAAALAPTIAENINNEWRKTIISPSASDAVMMQTISEMLGA